MLTTSSLLAAWLPARLPAVTTSQALSQLAMPELPPALAAHQDLCRIGRLYLRELPAETGVSTLARTLLPVDTRHEEQLTATIRRRVEQDFMQGDTVQIDGWVLARTEARQAALYTLLYG